MAPPCLFLRAAPGVNGKAAVSEAILCRGPVRRPWKTGNSAALSLGIRVTGEGGAVRYAGCLFRPEIGP
jgi:hypothetical protein